jgi:hypothetical protein
MTAWRGLVWCLLAVTATIAGASATPAEKCRAKKNQIAGRYSECRQKAEGKLAVDGDTAKYGASLTKCATIYGNRWSKAEAAAVSAGGICPTTGDQTSIEGAVSAHTTNVASALAGGPLDDCDGALATCRAELDACEAAPCVIPSRRLVTGQTTCSDAAGIPIACAGTGQDGEVQAGLSRTFTDNGDGTITDGRTGLTWEKLSSDGSIHNGGTLYTWNAALTAKIAVLNTTPCFAGHCDWRLPNVTELQSLAAYEGTFTFVPAFVDNCSSGCDVLTCSCGVGAWTSTDYRAILGYAWVVTGSQVAGSLKTLTWPVQAVRGGL